MQTATQARRLISEQRDRIGIPIVLVTHDPMDAVMLAARTVVLHEGRVVQQGQTREVLGHPNSAFVAAIAGVNLVAGVADRDGVLRADAGTAPATGSGTRWMGHGDQLSPGEAGTAVFSPGSVRIHSDPAMLSPHVGDSSSFSDVSAPNSWTGTITHLEPIPGGVRLFTAQHPDIAVDCSSMIAVDRGVRPEAVLSFSILEQDVSVRNSQ